MAREWCFSLGFLGLSAGLAYYSSVAPTGKVGVQEWSRLDPKEVSEVQFLSPEKLKIKAFKKADSDSRFWIEIERVGDKPLRILSSQQMNEWLKAFNPLYIHRLIPAQDIKDLKDFGFGEAPKMLSFKRESKPTLEFHFGQAAYGARQMYVKDLGLNQVALIDSDDINGLLEYPEDFIEDKFIDKELGEAKNLSLAFEGKSKTFVSETRDKMGRLLWSDIEGTEAPKLGLFLESLTKLRIQQYASTASETLLTNESPWLGLSIKAKEPGKKDLDLKFVKLEKAPPDAPSDALYWVYSSSLGAYGSVSSQRLATFNTDLKALLGTD